MTTRTISLGITNPDDMNNLGLSIQPEDRYLQITHGFEGTIVWNLEGESTANAQFDNPPIIFNGDPIEPTHAVSNGGKTLTVDWSNTQQIPATGVSHFYTLEIFVEFVIESVPVRMPLAHDPTVHNDPPGQ